MPLGTGDETRCPACATVVPIPAAYLRLRSAAALDDVARARAEAISVELARPPSAFMQFWTAAGAIAVVLATLLVIAWLLVSLVLCIGSFWEAGIFGALIMLLMGLVLGVPLLYDETLHALADTFGMDLADVWGGAIAYGLLGLSFWLLTAMPMILAAYAESFEAVRTALRTALAANPASTPGGAEQCHGCGGPLDVPADQLHARCIYCGADNIAHVDRTTLSKLEEDMQIVCEDLESAIDQETSTARTGRWLAAKRLLEWAALVPVFILLGRCVGSINENDVTFWHRAVPTTPLLPHGEDNPPLPRGEPTLFDVHQTFDRCDERECGAYYYAALEAGEHPRIVVEGGELRLAEVSALVVGPWYNPSYHWMPIELDDGAPHAGWYRVQLVKSVDALESPTVTWSPSFE